MVTVIGAPGYEDFTAELIIEVLRADGVMVCVLGDPITEEIFVIESRYVDVQEEEEC